MGDALLLPLADYPQWDDADDVDEDEDGEKDNPYHEPAGSPIGGQFASAPGSDHEAGWKGPSTDETRARFAAIRQEIATFGSNLSAEQAAKFERLTREAYALQFDHAGEMNPDNVKSPEERKSTLSNDVVVAARRDLRSSRNAYMAISEAAAGVHFDSDTAVDRIMRGNDPDMTPEQFYRTFANTREALRTQYGDKMHLYRATGAQREKPTTNWATTRAYAAQFGSNIIESDVPISDVIAVNVGIRGDYHEVIVGAPPVVGEKDNPYHEPAGSPEGGRFASAPGGSDVESRVIAEYGTTRDWHNAGYILRDGRMLDFDRTRRTVPHEEVSQFLPEQGGMHGSSMRPVEQVFMLETGAIRFTPEYPGVEIAADGGAISMEQLTLIRRVMHDAVRNPFPSRNTSSGVMSMTIDVSGVGPMREVHSSEVGSDAELHAFLDSLHLLPRGGEKSLTTDVTWLFTDDTWRDLRAVLVPIARSIFTEAFMVGAQLATQQKPGRKEWNEADHPREAAGTEEGGQFTEKGVALGEEYVQDSFPLRKAVLLREDGAYVVAPGTEEHTEFAKRLDPDDGFRGLMHERGWIAARGGLYRADDLIVSIYREPTSAQMRAIERASTGRRIDYSIAPAAMPSEGAPVSQFRMARQVSYETFARDVRDAFAGRTQSLLSQFRSLDNADLFDIMRGRKAPISLLDSGLGLPWLPFDFDAVLDAAQAIIALYTDSWWQQFTMTTQERLRAIIARAQAESLTMPEIIDLVEPLFGPQRARAIAVTETTRLLGLGAQETYKQAGFGEWAWRTVMDTRVDLVCEELGKQNDGNGARFPMTVPFVPAHVNCRCWPVPWGRPSAPSGLIPGVPPQFV